jgi:hypothetical protein
METRDILDQLSQTYGQPTPAALEINDVTFCGPYSAAKAPEVLFRRIENCAEIAILVNNPYTDQQLINNGIASSSRPACSSELSSYGIVSFLGRKHGLNYAD